MILDMQQSKELQIKKSKITKDALTLKVNIVSLFNKSVSIFLTLFVFFQVSCRNSGFRVKFVK